MIHHVHRSLLLGEYDFFRKLRGLLTIWFWGFFLILYLMFLGLGLSSCMVVKTWNYTLINGSDGVEVQSSVSTRSQDTITPDTKVEVPVSAIP